jgi:hypothetical protein
MKAFGKMSLLRKIRLSNQALLKRRKLDAEMDEEMRAHVAMLTHENTQAGMTPEQARLAALRSFGGLETVKEICREERSLVWFETFTRAALSTTCRPEKQFPISLSVFSC